MHSENAELADHDSSFRPMFVNGLQSSSKQLLVRAESESEDADSFSTLPITWEPIFSLKQKFAQLLIPNDMLGVSVYY